MVWGGISMEGRTDLYRLENGSLNGAQRKFNKEDLNPHTYQLTAAGPKYCSVNAATRTTPPPPQSPPVLR
ncbi:unnamed protein product [Pleuronectes platessa]|uniref:Uncharacterized protein n=1 Tax=Pleuronectes platessa TaxID=8262 RepID=A0A9N7TTB7_PLEPL|nr:unnamed protein product [Pleuronectes platessa]